MIRAFRLCKTRHLATAFSGEGARLKTDIVRPDPLVAPLQRGQSVGVLRVTLANGTPVTEVPLSVLEAVEESGVLGRAWDALRLWIQ
jgi:D-alanyl-D-alanine carboxypeptidase (penicillin-binding protein 5/6)